MDHPTPTYADYAALDAWNWSLLKKLRDGSPLHAHHARTTPDDTDTDTFRVGRAFHTLALEPSLFDATYAVYPKRRQGKEWDAFEAENEGKTILTVGQYGRAKLMAHAVRTHPLAMPYFTRGRAEQTIVWTDEATGIRCKGRADWISFSKRAVVDLKKCRSAERNRFGRAAASLGYHCQGAHYLSGARATRIFDDHDPAFVIIAVEDDPPYDVSVFRMDPAVEVAAREEVDALLAQVRECIDAGAWPGRYSEEQPLDLPAWVFADPADEDPEAMGFKETSSG